MKKRIVNAAALALAMVMLAGGLAGCSGKIRDAGTGSSGAPGTSALPETAPAAGKLTRYDANFLRLFDTVTTINGFAKDEETFRGYAEELHQELTTYHQLYDIYNDYDGINNVKTINDNAGIQPVVVDERIIDMLELSREMYEESAGTFNVAMGSVLSIWHEYRTDGIADPLNAQLPPMDELRAAAEHTDISQMIIDREASTVYLADPEMSLDVGAIAKGYATEMACRTLEADGLRYALVSVGGNVRAIGTKDNGELWKVGIQNPDLYSDIKYLHTAALNGMSLVSSGSYQRYYTVGGKTYHHIIHPDTLMPADEYVSVSILCQDSGMADALSTCIYNMPLDKGMAWIEGLDGVEAMWIEADGTEHFSSGFQAFLIN